MTVNAPVSFAPFAASSPRWYAIPAHRPFLEDLAAGVLAWLGELPPETLSDATILLPNRRAARAFTGALSKLSGERPILPASRSGRWGDLEEDEPPFTPGALGLDLPPAIPALTRRFEMARMIVEQFDSDLTPMRALDLADALGGFLDSCQLEEIPNPERIATLVDGEMAEHWERSAEFLGLAVTAWPKRLAELGLVDPAWRRAALLRRLAELWDAHPPIQAVIAAGSTGTVPAAGDVLRGRGQGAAGLRRPARPRPRSGRRRLGPVGRTASAERDETAAGSLRDRARKASVPGSAPPSPRPSRRAAWRVSGWSTRPCARPRPPTTGAAPFATSAPLRSHAARRATPSARACRACPC